MAKSGKLFGQASIYLDGAFVKSMPGASLDVGGVKRNTKSGNGWHGFTEEDAPSVLECEIAVDEVLAPKEIHDAGGQLTLTFACDTGQQYVIANGWSTVPPVLTDGEGKAKFVFNGPPAQEVGS